MTRLSCVIWNIGPWNTWPLLSCATIVPRVPPVSVHVKVAPRPPLADWPVPMPVVVQPETAIAKSDAAATLILKAVMLSLLSNEQNVRRWTAAPLRLGNKTEAERSRWCVHHSARFIAAARKTLLFWPPLIIGPAHAPGQNRCARIFLNDTRRALASRGASDRPKE